MNSIGQFRMHGRSILWMIIVMTLIFGFLSKNANGADYCRTLTRQKTAQAVLFDESGIQVTEKLNLGNLDQSLLASYKDDFLFSKKKFRLVLYPKKLKLETLCSQSFCVELKKVKSQCSSTSEYILIGGVVPYRIGPGNFESEIDFRATDPDSDFAPEIQFSFEQKVIGTLSMPWVKVQWNEDLSIGLKNVFLNDGMSAKLQLINSGDRPINLGTWEPSEKQQGLQIKENLCEKKRLNPLEHCTLSVVRTGQEKSFRNFYFWTVDTGSGNSAISLEIERFDSGKIFADIKNH